MGQHAVGVGGDVVGVVAGSGAPPGTECDDDATPKGPPFKASSKDDGRGAGCGDDGGVVGAGASPTVGRRLFRRRGGRGRGMVKDLDVTSEGRGHRSSALEEDHPLRLGTVISFNLAVLFERPQRARRRFGGPGVKCRSPPRRGPRIR